jgi:hypothetical protein
MHGPAPTRADRHIGWVDAGPLEVDTNLTLACTPIGKLHKTKHVSRRTSLFVDCSSHFRDC